MTDQRSIADEFLTDSIELLQQSMVKIRACLNQLTEQQIRWRPHPDSNHIANLILHICGNLRQWSVSGVGGLPDTRDRDAEFAQQIDLDKQQLIQHATDAVQQCEAFLATVTPEQLLADYQIQGFQVSGLQALNHTITHFVGHTHQIIYITRQILGSDYQFVWSPDQGRDQLPI